MASDDEDNIELEPASDEEDNGIVIEFNDSDNEPSDHSDNEEVQVEEELEQLTWSREIPEKRRRRSKKDVLSSSAQLTFDCPDILCSFDHFMSSQLKELLVKYTNLKGN